MKAEEDVMYGPQRQLTVSRSIDVPSVVSLIEDAFLERLSLFRTPFNLGLYYSKKGLKLRF